MTLITVQQEYIDTVNAGIDRWSHRKDGGHAHRIWRGARRKLEAALSKLGFTAEQIQQALKDARDMAELERISE